MTTRECYERLGEDYFEVQSRFGSENLVKKFALKFLEDKTYDELCGAVKNGDAELAFRMAHTLKGICLNLGFGKLYKASFDLTEDLRGRKLEGYEENLGRVKQAHDEIASCICLID